MFNNRLALFVSFLVVSPFCTAGNLAQGAPVNLATSGTASASSVLTGYPAANAINGIRIGDDPDI